MTHYQSAINELADRLQGADASLTTSIADILAVALQELIEAELTARIGAEPGERVPTRSATGVLAGGSVHRQWVTANLAGHDPHPRSSPLMEHGGTR